MQLINIESNQAADYLKRQWHALQFTRKVQVGFLEDVTSLMQDGVPAQKALTTIREISTNITHVIADDMLLHLSQGGSLALGMETWFAREVVEVIRAGESSGALVKSLQSALEVLAQRSTAVNVLLNALVYPIVVVVLACVVLVFIKSTVLNSFVTLHPIIQWPAVGQHLYSLATLIQYGWWIVLILFGALLFGMAWIMRFVIGPVRQTLDQFPPFSLYRRNEAAHLMETLGLLMANGVVFKRALQILHNRAAPYLAWHLSQMEARLSNGLSNIADVLDTRLIDKADLIRLKVVALSKGIDQTLLSLGRQARTRVMRAIGISGRVVGGVLLAATAIMAMMMVFGIYSIGSSVVNI